MRSQNSIVYLSNRGEGAITSNAGNYIRLETRNTGKYDEHFLGENIAGDER
jgi:hypothetical protein